MSITGWWYTYPSEKYEFVSWDDYSQYTEKNERNECWFMDVDHVAGPNKIFITLTETHLSSIFWGKKLKVYD